VDTVTFWRRRLILRWQAEQQPASKPPHKLILKQLSAFAGDRNP